MIFWNDLNDQQRQSVEKGDGIFIVQAGPGTGKTKTLTCRIVYLLTQKKIRPEAILALTFTKRAAGQMRERLKVLLKSDLPLLAIHTFHSFAYSRLTQYDSCPQIISDREQAGLIKKIIGKYSFRKFKLLLTRYKNGIGKVSLGQRKLIDRYSAELKKINKVDFDDLLLSLYRLLKNNKKIRDGLKSQYQYILIDEFQDTNDLQYRILKLILNDKQNLFAIGDKNQSIFSFRGANPAVFDQLCRDFPGSSAVVLSTNYRSSPKIIAVGNRLFGPNLSATVGGNEGEVKLVRTADEYREADWILQFINEKIGGFNMMDSTGQNATACFSDFAIVYRSHRLKNAILKKIEQAGLPYQTVGSGSIFQNTEVEFICLVLIYLNEQTEANLQPIGSCLWAGHKRYAQDELAEKLQSCQSNSSVLSEVVRQICLLFSLPENEPDLIYFQGSLLQFDQYPDGLARFCRYYGRIKDWDFYDGQADKITLLTMHTAKGLEFRYVFIIGFEGNYIPASENELEEEKRLFYVALTRAKEGAYLLQTSYRNRRLSSPSIFQKEIEGFFEEIVDKNLPKDIKRQMKKKLKKSQLKMF